MGAQDDLAFVGRVVERLFVVLVSFPSFLSGPTDGGGDGKEVAENFVEYIYLGGRVKGFQGCRRNLWDIGYDSTFINEMRTLWLFSKMSLWDIPPWPDYVPVKY